LTQENIATVKNFKSLRTLWLCAKYAMFFSIPLVQEEGMTDVLDASVDLFLALFTENIIFLF